MFTREEISEICKDFGLPSRISAVVERYVRPGSIRITEREETDAAGISKWWGVSDLSTDTSPFICRIRLRDIPRREWRVRVPSDGMLSFFSDESRTKLVRIEFEGTISNIEGLASTGAQKSRAMIFEEEFLFPDPSALLGLMPSVDWAEFVDFFKELHLDPPTISSSSRILCPVIEGYNQKDLTFASLYTAIGKVTGLNVAEFSSAELFSWGVLAYLDLPDFPRRLLVLSRGDGKGNMDTRKFFLSFGET